MLRIDLGRLDSCFSLESFRSSLYTTTDVIKYYNETTHRDYKILELFTKSTAMHTELIHENLPYKCNGQLLQLLHILPYMSSKSINVLEIGFGKGTNMIFLASLFPRVSFVGIDLIDKHVKYATQQSNDLPNVTFLQGDAKRLPSFSMKFDVIFCIESLCHLDTDEDIEFFLKNVKELLTPDGKLIIVDGFRKNNYKDDPSILEAMNIAESGFRIRRMTSKEQYYSLSRAMGLKIIDDIDLTENAVRFWVKWWKVGHLFLKFMPFLLRWVMRPETRANFVSIMMVGYALSLGSAEYGVLAVGNNN